MLLAFGYWKACLAVIPAAVVLCGVLAGLTYAISRDGSATFAAVNRVLALCVAVVPSLALAPIHLVRSFSGLGMPPMVTLGMMITLNFFPLLRGEVRQVREAMQTRGAGSVINPQILYRAFLIPLLMRLVNISDTLALSVETRGFSKEAGMRSVYKPVKARRRDVLFLALVAAGGLAVMVW